MRRYHRVAVVDQEDHRQMIIRNQVTSSSNGNIFMPSESVTKLWGLCR